MGTNNTRMNHCVNTWTWFFYLWIGSLQKRRTIVFHHLQYWTVYYICKNAVPHGTHHKNGSVRNEEVSCFVIVLKLVLVHLSLYLVKKAPHVICIFCQRWSQSAGKRNCKVLTATGRNDFLCGGSIYEQRSYIAVSHMYQVSLIRKLQVSVSFTNSVPSILNYFEDGLIKRLCICWQTQISHLSVRRSFGCIVITVLYIEKHIVRIEDLGGSSSLLTALCSLDHLLVKDVQSGGHVGPVSV